MAPKCLKNNDQNKYSKAKHIYEKYEKGVEPYSNLISVQNHLQKMVEGQYWKKGVELLAATLIEQLYKKNNRKVRVLERS